VSASSLPSHGQRRLDERFEQLQLVADRGRRDVELVRGRGDRAETRECLERADGAQRGIVRQLFDIFHVSNFIEKSG